VAGRVRGKRGAGSVAGREGQLRLEDLIVAPVAGCSSSDASLLADRARAVERGLAAALKAGRVFRCRAEHELLVERVVALLEGRPGLSGRQVRDAFPGVGDGRVRAALRDGLVRGRLCRERGPGRSEVWSVAAARPGGGLGSGPPARGVGSGAGSEGEAVTGASVAAGAAARAGAGLSRGNHHRQLRQEILRQEIERQKNVSEGSLEGE
jgi:hypothetical protein